MIGNLDTQVKERQIFLFRKNSGDFNVGLLINTKDLRQLISMPICND